MSGHPFKIYNASAGSGKTHTLTKEYLKIILSAPHSFGQILALTFTNKAVNEMKQRILNSLFEFSTIDTADKLPPLFVDLSNELNLDQSTLQSKSKQSLKDILHNYGFFDISTIDKFNHRVIRTFAKDLKLAQNFEVVLDNQLLLNEAIDNLLEKVGKEEVLTKILMDFALEKIDEDKSWDISYDLDKIGKLIFNENNADHLKLIENKGFNSFIDLQKIIGAKIRSIESEAKESAQHVLDDITNSNLEFKDFKRETLPNHFKKICEDNFTLSKLYNNKLQQDLSENKVLKAGVQCSSDTLLSEILSQYIHIKNMLVERSFLKNVLNQLVPLTVLNAIQKEVKTIQKEKSQLSISEFNTLISSEIKNQPAPFIYERLGEKYRHYFIDEFQDTSELQWNNLIPLIGNALEGEDLQGNSGTLFLVGDAKQAIYRWRGGKAEQFLDLINLKSNPFVISPKDFNLPSNYRSHEEVIKFNNSFFTTTSPLLKNDLYNKMFYQGNQQAFNTKKGGYVQLTFLDEQDKKDLQDSYCAEVHSTITNLKDKGHPNNDIAILIRDNKHGVILADYLSKQGVPIISPDSLLLSKNEKVSFLINLLTFSIDQNDLESAFNIVYFLSEGKNDPGQYISSNHNDLNHLFRTEYDFDINSLNHNSVYDGLEKAIKKFNLVEESCAYVSFFMDVVFDVEQKDGIGTYTFLHHWQQKKDSYSIAAPTSMDAIQIMSVHKAKGLEFPIVIFPFANSHIYKEIDPKLWLEVKASEFNGFEEVLISKKNEVLEYGSKAAEVFEKEVHKLELDAFNILYVALTRAEKELHIITYKDLTRGNEKLDHYSGLFIHYLKEKGMWTDEKLVYSFGSETHGETSLHGNIEEYCIPYQYTNRESPTFNILTNAGSLWDSNQEKALSKGNLLHHIMALIETEDDVQSVFKKLKQDGTIDSNEGYAFKQKVLQIIHHSNLDTYYKKGNIVKNEMDIIAQNGEILRPDRVVINDKKATVIDYKTGKPNKAYHNQINTYASAIEAMDYEIEKKIIIYVNEELNIEYI